MDELVERWRTLARSDRQRILLADAGDERVLEAQRTIEEEGLAIAEIVSEERHLTPAVRKFAAESRSAIDLSDPLNVAVASVAVGEADGCVAGASRPSSHVIRSGLRILGLATENSVVSGAFLFLLRPTSPGARTSVIAFADCAVVVEPDSEQLASIARSTAHTFRSLTETEALVAMLSFSTKGSAEHPSVEKVRKATALVRSQASDLAIDGEIQFDAAFDSSVAKTKAATSLVAGNANVFVFPNLDAGNIAYKILERLGGATAYGPLLQGLNGTLHDLSRGCSVDDIVGVTVIAAVQAQQDKRIETA